MIDKLNIIQKFLTWLEKFVQTKYGLFLIGFCLIGGGLYYSHYRYEEGKQVGLSMNENTVKILNIQNRELIEKNRKLQMEKDSLLHKINKDDVFEEAKKRLEKAKEFEEIMKNQYLQEKKENEILGIK